MNHDNSPSIGPILVTFLAGAALGAVVVALTTPRTGPELRNNLKEIANRGKRKAGDMADEACEAWNDLKDRTSLAAADLQRGMADAAKDLQGSSKG